MNNLPNNIKNSLKVLLQKDDLDALINYVNACCEYSYKRGFFEGKLKIKEKIEKNLKENIRKELSFYLGDWDVKNYPKLKRVRCKGRENLIKDFIKKLLANNL